MQSQLIKTRGFRVFLGTGACLLLTCTIGQPAWGMSVQSVSSQTVSSRTVSSQTVSSGSLGGTTVNLGAPTPGSFAPNAVGVHPTGGSIIYGEANGQQVIPPSIKNTCEIKAEYLYPKPNRGDSAFARQTGPVRLPQVAKGNVYWIPQQTSIIVSK